MSLSKQAKTLTKPQIKLITGLIHQTRHPVRNQAIFLLSVRGGLRAKEIAGLTWEMSQMLMVNWALQSTSETWLARGGQEGSFPSTKTSEESFRSYSKTRTTHPLSSQQNALKELHQQP